MHRLHFLSELRHVRFSDLEACFGGTHLPEDLDVSIELDTAAADMPAEERMAALSTTVRDLRELLRAYGIPYSEFLDARRHTRYCRTMLVQHPRGQAPSATDVFDTPHVLDTIVTFGGNLALVPYVSKCFHAGMARVTAQLPWVFGCRLSESMSGRIHRIDHLVVLSDGCVAGANTEQRSIAVWNATSNAYVTTLTWRPRIPRTRTGYVMALAPLDNGGVACAQSDGVIKLWKRNSLRPLLGTARAGINAYVCVDSILLAEGTCPYVLAVTRSGHLASGEEDGTVRFWKVSTTSSSREHTMHHHTMHASLVSVLSSCKDEPGRLASADVEGGICIWNVDNSTVHSWYVNQANATPIRYRQAVFTLMWIDSLRIASGGTDGWVTIWDTAEGTGVRLALLRAPGRRNPPRCSDCCRKLLLLHNGMLACHWANGTLSVWSLLQLPAATSHDAREASPRCIAFPSASPYSVQHNSTCREPFVHLLRDISTKFNSRLKDEYYAACTGADHLTKMRYVRKLYNHARANSSDTSEYALMCHVDLTDAAYHSEEIIWARVGWPNGSPGLPSTLDILHDGRLVGTTYRNNDFKVWDSGFAGGMDLYRNELRMSLEQQLHEDTDARHDHRTLRDRSRSDTL